MPKDLFAQMNEDGRLVCVCLDTGGEMFVHTKHDGRGDRAVFDADVPPSPGFKRLPRFVF